MNRRTRRGMRVAALAASVSMLAAGCDFSVYDIPLPGGADTGDNPYTVTVYFDDVLDLVPQSAVKVRDVTVGKVEDISLRGYTAKLKLELNRHVKLPDNAVATIRQTSLLGEKFVSLAPPAVGATGRLEDGEEIPLSRTGRNPEVEEVLGALSLLLNGGGVAQLKTITVELNKVLDGNESGIRSLLSQLDTFMGQLDENKQDIVRAIEAVNRLAKATKAQTSSITAALEDMPRALDSLDKQRDDLIRMLHALGRLSDVGTRVIDATKENTVKSLQSLAPILSELADAGRSLPKAMQVFLTYPFVDAVVGNTPQEARNLHQGDYTNLSAKLDIDLQHLITQQPSLFPKGQSPTDKIEGQVQKGLDQLRNGAGGGAKQLQDQLRRGQRRLQDQLRKGPGGALGGPLQQRQQQPLRNRRQRPAGGGGSGGGGGGGDCVLGVVCRAQPGFAGNVLSTPADTVRLGYDPDVAALLLQGVNVR
jgi:phospholipid/cholesterol/gamma-HCH transport system substrate-binding protein